MSKIDRSVVEARMQLLEDRYRERLSSGDKAASAESMSRTAIINAKVDFLSCLKHAGMFHTVNEDNMEKKSEGLPIYELLLKAGSATTAMFASTGNNEELDRLCEAALDLVEEHIQAGVIEFTNYPSELEEERVAYAEAIPSDLNSCGLYLRRAGEEFLDDERALRVALSSTAASDVKSQVSCLQDVLDGLIRKVAKQGIEVSLPPHPFQENDQVTPKWTSQQVNAATAIMRLDQAITWLNRAEYFLNSCLLMTETVHDNDTQEPNATTADEGTETVA